MDDGIKKFAEKRNVRQETAARRCREGKIPGATQDAKGSPRHIPARSKDPRKK